MDVPQEKFVVQTEFSAKLQTEYNTVFMRHQLRYTAYGVAGVVCLILGVVFLVPPLKTSVAENTIGLGSILVVFGVVFLLLAWYYPRSIKKGENLPIKPNKISLTFSDAGVEVDASGGKPGEIYFSYITSPGTMYAGGMNDIKRYGTEHWAYKDLNVNVAEDYFCLAPNFVFYGIVFRESQITEGDPIWLRKLLKEKLEFRYKEKRSR